MNMLRPSRRGFSLVEVIVVISIIAFMAVCMFSVVPGVKENARKRAAQNQLRYVGFALQDYAREHAGDLPTDSGYGLSKNGGLVGATRLYDAGSLLHYLGEPIKVKTVTGAIKTTRYMSFAPGEISTQTYLDPERGASRWIIDPWGNPVGYTGSKSRVIHNRDNGFDLFSAGKDGKTAFDLDAAGLVSYGLGGNRAYDGAGEDDASELGSAALNGSLTRYKTPLPGEVLDDLNNWEQE